MSNTAMTMPSKVTGWKPKGGTVYFYNPDPDWLAKQSADDIDTIRMIRADIAEELAKALRACPGSIGRNALSRYDAIMEKG